MSTPIDELLERGRLYRRLPDAELRALLRERLGASQAEVGGVVGVTAATVSRWEAGTRKPAGEHLRRYVELLEHFAREAAS